MTPPTLNAMSSVRRFMMLSSHVIRSGIGRTSHRAPSSTQQLRAQRPLLGRDLSPQRRDASQEPATRLARREGPTTESSSCARSVRSVVRSLHRSNPRTGTPRGSLPMDVSQPVPRPPGSVAGRSTPPRIASTSGAGAAGDWRWRCACPSSGSATRLLAGHPIVPSLPAILRERPEWSLLSVLVTVIAVRVMLVPAIGAGRSPHTVVRPRRLRRCDSPTWSVPPTPIARRSTRSTCS